MRSSYLKLKAACLLKKVKPGPARQRGFGSSFISRMIGSSAHGAEMNMIPVVSCVARALPLDSAGLNQDGADPAPDLRG